MTCSLYAKYGAKHSNVPASLPSELIDANKTLLELIGKESGFSAFEAKIDALTESLDQFAADPHDKEISENLRKLMIDAQEILRTDEQASSQLLPSHVRQIVCAQRAYFHSIDHPKPKATAKAKPLAKPKKLAKEKPRVLSINEDTLFD